MAGVNHMSEELRNYRVGNQHAKKHGFSAENLCLSTEERPEYDALTDTFTDQFQPVGGVEMEFVHEMVNARWRMKRIVISETAAINNQIVINETELSARPEEEKKQLNDTLRTCMAFYSLAHDGKALPLFIRYQDCYRRAYNAAYKHLMQLQADRRKNPPPENPVDSKKSMFFFENTDKIQNQRLGLPIDSMEPLPRPDGHESIDVDQRESAANDFIRVHKRSFAADNEIPNVVCITDYQSPRFSRLAPRYSKC